MKRYSEHVQTSTSHLHYYKHNVPFIQVETGDIKTFKLIIPIRMKTLQIVSERSKMDDAVPHQNTLVSKFHDSDKRII